MFGKFRDCPYTRPDIDAQQKALNDAAARIYAAQSYAQVREELLKWNEKNKELSQAVSVLHIRHYGNSADEFYEREFGEVMPAVAALDTAVLSSALVESPFAKELDAEFGPQYLDIMRRNICLRGAGLDLMAREQELVAEYQQCKATLKVCFDGREMSEAEAEKYAQSADRAVRRAVRKAIFAAHVERREDFARIFGELVPLRVSIAKANGFDSYLDYMNLEKGRTGYGEAELTGFCEQVKRDLVPFVRRLRQAQAKRLGLERLMPYDMPLLFPDGNPAPAGEADFLLEAAKKMYAGLGPEMGEFFTMMLDHELLDVKASPNKIANMGFCTDLPVDRVPFVFGNCNGTDWDITVITHEVGHAFQMYQSMQAHQLLEYAIPCNDVAEIPSKAMEQFTHPYADQFSDNGDKYRFKHLHGVLEEILGFCAIHEYESWLYAHPEADFDARVRMFGEVQLRYNPDLDYSEFRAEVEAGALLFRSMAVYMFPRYVISYALCNMGALAFKERMEADSEAAWAGYMRLCQAGGSLLYPALLKLADLPCAYEEGVVERSTGYAKRTLTDYIRAEGLWD